MTIYTTWGPKPRQALTQAFEEKYGINAEFSVFTRGTETIAKVNAEQKASLKLVDVFGGGNSTLIGNMKPQGLLSPVEPLLVLPEVLDPKAWRGGRLPYTDKEGLSGSSSDITNELMAVKAPIKFAMIEEDSLMTAVAGALGVPGELAHPNAAMVFINWLLSAEGQSVFANSFGSPSMRLDASTEGINPLLIPTEGKKYYPEREEFIEAKARWQEINKRIIEETRKWASRLILPVVR